MPACGSSFATSASAAADSRCCAASAPRSRPARHRWSGPPAPASRRCCGCSTASPIPTPGTISYNGRPLAQYDPLELRREVSLVPQLPALIEGRSATTSTIRRPAGGMRAGLQPQPATRRPRRLVRRPRRDQALGRRAAAGDAGPGAGPAAPRSCCSTSRPRRWTRRHATRSSRRSPTCAARSTSRSCSSAMTPRRRAGWVTGYCGSRPGRLAESGPVERVLA